MQFTLAATNCSSPLMTKSAETASAFPKLNTRQAGQLSQQTGGPRMSFISIAQEHNPRKAIVGDGGQWWSNIPVVIVIPNLINES